jgi:nucleotidyltransferase substrate binding protein (TIGR01987 family)
MPLAERYQQRLNDFEKALGKLQQGLEQAEDELDRDGVIQRFEFTYEQAWKTLRIWLSYKDIDVRNAKDALKEALTQGLIEDGNLWSRLHESRNLTSHTYDEKSAARIFEFIEKEGCQAFDALFSKLGSMPPS